MNWKKYYPLPIALDEAPYHSYAWTWNNEMALGFDRNTKRELALKIVDAINEVSDFKIENLNLRDNVDFYDGDTYIFCVRGWGALTGIGGHKLPEKKAIQIQDDFVKFIYEKLKS